MQIPPSSPTTRFPISGPDADAPHPTETPATAPSINPLIHLSSNPLPLSALAAILGCSRSTIRHFAEKLSFRYTIRRIGPRHKRTACLTPDQAIAIATEIEREAASISPTLPPSDSPSPILPVSPSPTLGSFYLLQLEPHHDPGRLKLGFSTDVESRLDDLRTVVPLAKLIATWPCHRSWERIAIISTAQNAEPLSQEVFRCTHIEEAVAAADRFFAVMPNLNPPPLRSTTNLTGTARRGAAESGSVALHGDRPPSAKHHFNPAAPPPEAPPPPAPTSAPSQTNKPPPTASPPATRPPSASPPQAATEPPPVPSGAEAEHHRALFHPPPANISPPADETHPSAFAFHGEDPP